MCRLYPFNYNEFGMIGLTYDKDMMCPMHLERAPEILWDELLENWERCDELRAMFYAELRGEFLERSKR